MSPTVEIVDLTKKIDDSLKERVLDPNRPVKDFDDVIELGMYNAYQLNDYDDFKFLEGMKNVEVRLTETPEFKKNAMQMDLLRRQLEDGVNNNPTFKSLVDGQNKLREQALQLLPPVPDGDTTEWIKRVHDITVENQRLWNDKFNYHKQTAEFLDLKIQVSEGSGEDHTEIDFINNDYYKREMAMHLTELEVATIFVKKSDPNYVSDVYKKHEKDIQEHIIRAKTRPKTGEGDDTKEMKEDMRKHYYYYHYSEGKTEKESYNLIKANHYPKKSVQTIEKYIKF